MLGLQWDDINWPHNLIDLRRTVAFRKGRRIVNTPQSGKLRTVDVASLTARLKDSRSIRHTQAVVDGVAVSPWVFPSATDPTRQLGHSSIQVTVDLYGHFIPGADRHHVEGLAAALETATEVTGEPRAIMPLDFLRLPTKVRTR